MICPHCNTRHQLGAERCQNCGTPFTRRAAREGGGPATGRGDYAGYAAPAGAYQGAGSRPRSQPPREYRRGAGPGSRALGGFIALLIITIVIIAGAALLGSIDTGSIADDVADRAGQAIGLTSGDDSDPPVDVPATPDQPAGEQTWVLTEEELNRRVAARADSFGPANDVQVELSEGTVTVRFSAYGVNGTYHGSLTARDGRPVVADSTVEGPIGWVVDSSQIDDVLNQEMANAVNEQQVSVESVHVRPGEVVFGVSS